MKAFKEFVSESKSVAEFQTRKIDIEFGIELYIGKTKQGKDFYLLKKDGEWIGKLPEKGGYPGNTAARNARVGFYAKEVNK